MQTPTSSAEHYDVQQKIGLTTSAAVNKLWQRMGDNFDSSWASIREPVLTVVQNGRLAAATQSATYVPQVLAETGQSAAPTGNVVPSAFVEATPAGSDVGIYLDSAVIRTKQAVLSGADSMSALKTGGSWLTGAVLTMIADTSRDVVSADIAQRPTITGYVRMLNAPSCARCVLLAGKWFRWNQGFLRHPNCDCRHIPAAEDVAGNYLTDPYEYFKSLSTEEQDRLFGKNEALAIREYGADIYRTMNIKMRGLGTAKSNRIYGTPMKRTVNDILANDPSRKFVLENLQYHGYITGPQVRGGNIIGTGPQAERFAGMTRGRGTITIAGQRVQTARASMFDARESGVRDPFNRATMTAAERRLYDANYRLQYARTTGTLAPSVGPNSADVFTRRVTASADDLLRLEKALADEIEKLPFASPSVQSLADLLGIRQTSSLATTVAATNVQQLAPRPAARIPGANAKPLTKDYLDNSVADLDQLQIRALEGYTKGNDQRINRQLRGLNEPVPFIAEQVKQIDSILERTPIPYETKLFRGGDADWLGVGDTSQLEGLIGKKVGWQNYISTTVNPNMPDLPKFGPIDYEIIAPAGTPGAYINSYSYFQVEEEFLLGRGLIGEVSEVVKNEETGRIRVVIRLVEADS